MLDTAHTSVYSQLLKKLLLMILKQFANRLNLNVMGMVTPGQVHCEVMSV